jgi:exodeoxyribonuclease VII small subunit
MTFQLRVGIVPFVADAEQGFDALLARLREVVQKLESGDLSLEQSLAVYEEGVQLARRGQQLLASAEKRVEILVSTSSGIETAPFASNPPDVRAEGAERE